MKFSEIEVFYFLGIGGIGMSALARYFHSKNAIVLGYDKTSTPLTTELVIEGISVHFDDSVLEIPSVAKHTDKSRVLVVYTPAIPADSIELNWFRAEGYTMMKRSQVLGLITENTKTIAVGGTHGKTTTSTLIAHILYDSGKGCNAFLGGIASNYQTNLLLSPDSEWTVVEADEYDRSFLTLTPTISVITSMDADHLDIYGSHEYMLDSFRLFADKTRPGGVLFHRAGLPLATEGKPYEILSYSAHGNAQFQAINLGVHQGKYTFDLSVDSGVQKYVFEKLELGLPGRHNVENAVAACAAALHAGVDEQALRKALASFKGVRRRFEYRVRKENIILIDDYAHHPEELKACINSVRELYPDKRITGVFQPHLFSRTRDFADEFARSLELLDDIVLLPIYPARELPMEGVHSQMLLDKISKSEKILVGKGGLLAELRNKPREIILMLGAGDIDALVPQVSEAFGGD
ncbi:MAG: UDP-N-acetylmuramate--L-alanine ligase [Flavobacteriales bacterium]